MKKIACTVIIFGFIAVAAQTVRAELRTWTDKNGKEIEAEHVLTLDDKVVLKLANGSEIRVSLDALSEKDRRYAILQRPIRIDIKVSPKTDRTNIGRADRGPGLQVQEETVEVDVSIRKSSPAPYEAPLKVEVFIIGTSEQRGGYVIVDRAISRFRFTTENKNRHEFTTTPVKLTQFESGRQTGVEYQGYLVAIVDRNGKILEIKSSKLDYTKNVETIMTGKKGTVFDDDFNLVGNKEDRKPKKVRNRFPGRRF